MRPTPVDDHTEEFEQLAGLSALDVLEGDERARFEAHAAHCERCRLMVRLDREALALAAPEMEPSPDFKARLMQRAATELAQQQPAKVIRLRLWRRSPWVAALAAVLVIGLVTAGAFTYENQVVATYALSGTLPGAAVVTVRRSGATQLDIHGVPAPPQGFLYEAWVIPPGGQPVPAGVATSGDATLSLDSVSSGSTVAMTLEKSFAQAPTLPVLMATEVRL
jgi:anti-sigma-K factor RskA